MKDEGVLTRAARVLLFLTALSPGLFLYAVRGSTVAGVIAVVLFWIGALTLISVEKAVATTVRLVVCPVKQETSLVAFLVFALPLINLAGLVLFVLIVSSLTFRGHAHWNALFACMGYRTFTAKNDEGGEVVVLSKQELVDGPHPVIWLTRHLWLASV